MTSKRERSRSRDKKQQKNYVDVYNLPQHLNKEDVVYFVWKTLQKCRALKKHTNPITNSQFIEELRCIRMLFRSREEALNCLDLNGVYYGTKAFYMKSPITIREISQIDLKNVKIRKISNRTEEGFNKLFVGGTTNMKQYEVVNFLSQFGQLKSFQPVLNSSKQLQHCFCEYVSSEETQDVLLKTPTMRLQGKSIVLKRATLMNLNETPRTTISKITKTSKPKSSFFEKDLSSFYLTFDTVGFFKTMKISCILLLKNIISNISEKQFVLQDIRKELEKVGTLTKVTSKDKNVYAQYERVQYAQIAYLVIMNKKYESKNIQISFYDPLKFADDILV